MLKQTSLWLKMFVSTLRIILARVFFAVLESVFATPVIFYTRAYARVSAGLCALVRVRARVHVRGVVRGLALVQMALLVVATTLAVTIAQPGQTNAAVSDNLNFQARLETPAGAIVNDGNYNVRFKLYNASTGGTALWTESYLNSASNGVRIVNGYLTVNLGSVTAFPNTISWDQDLYVTMDIGGTTTGSPTWDGEMNPRLKLTAVPYAFQAKSATQLQTTVSGNTTTLSFTTPTANNSILLPDASGTVCLANSSNCGFASSSGSSAYIQNGSSLQTNANFRIQSAGTGTITGVLQALTGQTADLLRFTDSSNNALSGFDASGNLFYQSGSYTGTLVQDTLGQSVTYHLPDPGGSSATICLTTGNCAGTGGGITGTGTTNYVARFNSGTTINASSLIYDNNTFVGINTTTNGGQLSVVSTNASQVGAFIQGANSATAPALVVKGGTTPGVGGDLAQFQDSSGTVLAKIDASGNLVTTGTLSVTGTSTLTGNTTVGGTLAVQGSTLSVGVANTTTGGVVFRNATNSFATTLQSSGPGQNQTINIPDSGATTDTVCLLSLANCTGTGGGIAGSGTQNYVARFDTLGGNHIAAGMIYDNGSFVGLGTTTNNGLLSIVGTSTTQTGLFVQGAASASADTLTIKASTSQTGNLAKFLDVNGTAIARVLADGSIQSSGVGSFGSLSTDTSRQLQVLPVSATTIGQVIQGFASQTADLLQFRNSSGTVLAKVDASGNLTAVGGTFTGNVSQTGTGTFSTGTGAVTLNGNTSISGTNTLTVGTGATSLGGTLGVTGLTTLSGGASITGVTDINTAGTAATTIGNAASTLTINAPTTLNSTGYINTNSTAAFKVEQNGVKNNVLVVNTTTGAVGINMDPTGGSSLQVAGVVLTTSDFRLNANTATSGRITRDITAGSTSIANNDVVVYDTTTSNRFITTTTPRDPRVYGVAIGAAASGASTVAATAGNTTVNIATTAAVSIGDQLVTSSVAGQVMVDNNATTGIVGYATQTKVANTGSTVGVRLAITAGQSTPRFQNQSNSTTAFQIQNAAGTSNLFNADTTNTRIGIGTNAPAYTLDVAGGTGIVAQFSGRVIGANAVNTNEFLTLGQANSLYASGTGTGSYILNGTTQQTANFNIQSAAAGSIGGVISGAVSQTASLLEFRNSAGTVLSAITAAGALQGGNGSGTNAAGTALTLNGGQGTGTGAGGNITLNIAAPGTSGSTANALTSVVTVSGSDGSVLFKNATNSAGALRVQAANSETVLQVDTSSSTSNLVTNGSFETNTTGWLALGGTTLSQSSSTAFSGASSLAITTTGTANQGAYFPVTLSPNTTYKLRIAHRVSASGGSVISFGRQDVSGTDISCTAGTYADANWHSSTCTFTTGGTISSSNIYVRQNDTVSRTINIDAVQLIASTNDASFTYSPSKISLNGAIVSPVNIINTYNSDNAFSVSTASGTSLLSVSTGDTRIFMNADVILGGSSQISQNMTAGNTVNTSDVVVLTNSSGSPRASTTTTPRDPNVVGVASYGASSGNGFPVRMLGTTSVNADASFGAIAIGDQLVTSSNAGYVMKDNNATTGIVGRARSALPSGTGTVTVQLEIHGGAPTPVFRSATNSVNAFQIQNAAGTSNLFNADTTNTRIGIGTNAPAYTLDVAGDINTTGVFRVNGTQISTSNLSDASNIAYLNGTGPQTFTGNNRFTGTVLLQNASNSASAFQVLDSSSNSLITADTSGKQVTIGYATNAATSLKVTGASSTSVPLATFEGGSGGVTDSALIGFNSSRVVLGYDAVTGGAILKASSGKGVKLYTDGSANAALSLAVNGSALFKNNTDSSTGFQIQNAAGTALLTQDTTTGNLTVNRGDLTVNAQLSGPTTVTLSTATSGGSLAANTYYYYVAAVNANGTSNAVPSSPTNVTTTGSTSVNTVTWSAVTGATSYRVYRSAGNNFTWRVNSVSSGTTTINDDGTAYTWGTTTALPVASNTTGGGNLNIANNYQINGNIVLRIVGTSNNFVSGAGNSNATGVNATGVGTGALGGITSGNNNSALGTSALGAVTTGDSNTGLGMFAGVANGALGNNLTTGSRNTLLGYQTNLTTSLQVSNSTAIGALSSIGQSNAIILGCTNGVNGCTATSTVGIGSPYAPNSLTVSPGNYGSSFTTGTGTTIAQTGTAITGTGTTFTAAMTGGTIYYSDGTTANVTYVDATHLTSSVSKTVSSGSTYNIVYGGFNVTSTGTAYLQPTTDSTTAFQVLSSTGAKLIAVDSVNNRVGIGAAPANSVLTVGTNTSTAAGGITFGTDTNLYRSGTGTLQTDGALNVLGSAGLTVGVAATTQGKLTLATTGAGNIILQSNAQTADRTLTIPTTGANDTICLQTLANCGGGTVGGTGTANYVARWTGTSALGTGLLYDNGTSFVGVNTATQLNGGTLSVQAATGSTGLVVQGASGQDIAAFYTSAGAKQAYIAQNGTIFSSGGANLTAGNLSTSGTTTVNTLTVTPSGTATTGTNINNGIFFTNRTALTGNIFNGLYFGTGYDSLLNYNGTSLISGSGFAQNALFDSSLNYSNLQNVTNFNVAGTLAVTGLTTLSGNTAIGTTPNANNKLLVSGVTTADNAAQVLIGTGSTTKKGLVIQSVASQSANVFETQDSTGVVLATIRPSGTITTSNSIIAGSNTPFSSNSALMVNGFNTTAPTTVIRAASSQTADILQNQDSNGAVLSGITSSGAYYTNGAGISVINLSVPAFTTTSTGTNFYYVITARNATGETIASAALGMANNTSTLSWNQVAGATSYNLYRNTTNSFTAGSLLRTTITNGTTTSFTDNGGATSAGLPPTNSASAGILVQASASAATTNAIRVTTNTGSELFSVSQIGVTNVRSAGTDYGGSLNVGVNGNTTRIGIAVRGAVSQASDLFQLQDPSTGAATGGFNSTGQFYYKSGSFSSVLNTTTLTANRTISLPDEAGTICLQNSTNCGFAAASALSGYVQLAPATAQTDTTTNSSIFINKTGASGNLLQLQKSGADVFTVGNTGAALFKNSTNSTAAFDIQNATGTSYFKVDTSGGNVNLGTAACFNGSSQFLLTSSCTGNGAKFEVGTAGFVGAIISQSGSSDILQLKNGTTNVLTVGSAGATLFKNSTNSSNALQVQTSGGSTLFGIDTSASKVVLGAGTASASSGLVTIGTGTTTAAGGLYFGTDTNLYRSAASTLQTDSSLVVGTNLSVTGTSTLTGLVTAQGGLTIQTGSQFTNASSTLFTSVNLGQSSGTLTASTTVDVTTTLNINQTSSATITLPSPTVGTSGRILFVNNVGGSDFTMNSLTIAPGNSASFMWNGTAWITLSSSSTATGTGINTIGALDGQTKSNNGAVISGATLYLQSADASFPGLVTTGTQTLAGNKTLTGLTVLSGGATITGTTQINASGAGTTAIGNSSAGAVTIASGAASSFVTTGAALTLTGGAASTFGTSAGALTLQGFAGVNVVTPATSAASTNSSGISISTGNATGATSNSGSITIDVGTATGTTGQLLLGTTNAASIQIGKTSQAIAIGGAVSGSTGVQINSSGQVGIGAAPAGATLTVGSTAGGSTTGIYFGDSNTALYRANSAQIATNAQLYANSGLYFGGGYVGTLGNAGNSTAASFQSGATTSSGTSGQVTLQSGANTGTGASGSVVVQSGTTAAGNTGSITIDAGAATGGTAGAVNIGTTNASAITVGRAGITTTVGGLLTVTGTTTLSSLTTGVVLSNGTGQLSSGTVNLASSSYVSGTLPVANGGTGATTLAANGILYGNGTSAIQATTAAANSILTTNGSNVPSLSQTLPSAVQGNITTLGTVTAGSLSTGFGTINTGNTITGTTLNATSALQLNGTSINTAGTLSNVAYLNQTNTFSAANTFSSTVAVQGSAGLTIGVAATTQGKLNLATTGAGNAIIQSNAQTADRTISLPTISANDTICLLTANNCAVANNVTGSGTANYVARFSGTNTIATGLLQDTTTAVYVSGSAGSGGGLFNVGTTNQFQVSSAGAVTAAGDLTVNTNRLVTAANGTAFGVGIGTATPTSNGANRTVLHIQDTTGNGAELRLNTSGGANTLNARVYNNGTEFGFGTDDAKQLRFFVGGGGNSGLKIVPTTFDATIYGKLLIGTAEDTNLYRSAASTLQTDGALNVRGSAGLTVGVAATTQGKLNLATTGAGNAIIQSNAQTADRTISLPTISANDTICLLTANNCAVANNVTGSGTANYVARFSGTNTIATGLLQDTTTAVYVSGSAGSGGGLFNVGTTNQFQVSSAGAVTAVGVNSGTGLIQGTGGATVTGTTQINATGAGTTAIGSSSAGAVTIASGAASSFVTTGAALTLTGGAASTFGTSAGALTLQGFAGVNVVTPATSTASTNSSAISISTGNATGATSTAGAITIDNGTSTTGTSQISIGNTNAGAITVGRSGITTTVGGLLTVTGTTTLSSLTTGVVLSNGTGQLSSGTVNLASSSYVSGTLPVGNGGTGATTLAANGILYGNGTSAIQATTAAANSILTTNGSNVPSLSQTLPSAVQGNITTLGTVTAGSLSTGFGTINTGNTITGTTINATSALQLNGTNINTAGTLSNVAYLNQTNTFTGATNTFTGSVAVQSTNGLTIGTAGTVGGKLQLANSTNSNLSVLQTQAPSGTGNATYVLPTLAGGTTDTLCLATLQNCTAIGSAGGDLTGTFPNPTVASLQGKTLTISTTPVTGNVLQWNGSAFVDAKITNTNLTAGTFSSITGVGALTAGSIGTGFGTISTGNSITTTAGLQGGTLSVASNAFQVNGSGAIAAVTGITTSGGYTQSGAGTNTFTGATQVSNTLAVTSTSSFTGLLTATGGITLGSAANFNQSGSTGTFSTGTGAVSLNGATSVTGSNTFSVGTGATSLGGTLGVTGLSTLSTLSVTSTSTFTGQLTANGGISVANNSSFSQTGTGTFGTGTGAVSLNGATTVSSTLAVQGSAGITIGQNASVAGQLTLRTTGAGSVSITSVAQTGNVALSIPAAGTIDEICLKNVGNCIAAGGALGGTGTVGRVAKFTTASQVGDSLLYDSGTSVYVGTATSGGGMFNVGNANQFQVSSAGAVTAVGVSFGSGNLSGTGNFVQTGAGTVSTGTGTVSLNGNTTVTTGKTFTVQDSLSTFGGIVALNGTVVSSATESRLQLGNAIAGGNANVNGGTYIGLNAPSTGAGSAADFLNLQYNGTSRLKVTNTGALTAGDVLTVTSGGASITGNSTITGTLSGLTGLTVASGGASITGNSTITGTLSGLTGLTVASGGASITGGLTVATGNVTITPFNTAGVVHNSAAGVLSSSLIVNADLTSGTYTNITGTGALNAGSITTGFGTINTSNAIGTSGNVTGGTLISTGAIQGQSLSINSGTFAVASSGAITAVTGIATTGGYVQSGASANTFTGQVQVQGTGIGLQVTNNATIGGTLSAGATTVASLSVGSAANQYVTIAGGAGNHGIEIGRIDGTASTPYIDLHAGATATDYDVRLIAGSATGTAGGGTLTINAGNISTSATYNSNTFTSSNLTFGAAAGATVQAANNQNLSVVAQGSGVLNLTGGTGGIVATAAGNVSLTASSAGTLALDTATGAINLGTSANAKTITIGNSTGATNLSLNAGASGNIALNTNNSTGGVLIQSNTNSTAAFKIQNATAADVLLNVDTTNNRIKVGNNTGTGTSTTLFQFDQATTNPGTNAAFLGSMYFDTTQDTFMCYNSTGWLACGASPDISVNLIPEYVGAVLNGSTFGSNNVGTLISDLCSNGTLGINTTLCANSGDDYNYYAWTSPQASAQSYSIYVRYQLPATFKTFADDNTVRLTARSTDVSTNVGGSTLQTGVRYTMYYTNTSTNALTACGSATQVTTTANTWQTVSLGGGGETACTANSGVTGGIGPNTILTFKIDVTAKSGSTAYVSNLSFLTKGK